MNERKNIDKLFQEKFKDFEMNPPENTWPELEMRLKKKKDRKVIPFWWKLSGVAAALTIGFLIGNGLGLFADGNESKNEVVIQDQPGKNSNSTNTDLNVHPKSQEAIVQGNDESVPQTTVVEASENNASENKRNSNHSSDNENPSAIERKNSKFNDYQKNTTDAIVKSNGKSIQQQQSKDKKSTPFNAYKQPDGSNAVARTNESTNEKSNQNTSGNNPKQRPVNQPNQKTNTNPETAVAAKIQKSKTNQPDLEQSHPLQPSHKDNVGNKPALENKSNTTVATRDNGERVGGTQNTTDPKTSEAAVNNYLDKNNNTTNAVATVEAKNQEQKIDSTAIATVVPNALEELLNEKENKVTKEPKLNRWQITSNVAPIYFGSTSGGSPIDSTFANNAKDYNTQVGYGIGLTYAVNKRFTVRTGINKVSLNYDTNDVELYAGMNEGGLQNLDSPAETEFLNFGRMVSATRNNAGTQERSQSSLAAADTELATDKFSGRINQKMGYIEVPVEVSYALINKKFGVNVIAGVSTLFLDENEVMLSSEGYKTDLGEANNLNSTHFSTNVGLGVKYSFLKSFEARFEPIFKYQLNTFSKDNGDFKPYFFGLYTGLSFRF